MAKAKRKRKRKAKRSRRVGNMLKGRFARRATESSKPATSMPSGGPMLSLEAQLAEHDRAPPGALDGDVYADVYAREWKRQRIDLCEAIKRRDARVLRDRGPDVSGKYGVSPFLVAKGHRVEVAPHIKASQGSEQFPKIIATQRVIDRYKAHGHISPVEWQAANKLWTLWVDAGAEFRVSSGYDPIFVQSSPSVDHIMAKRVDAAFMLNEIWDALPWRSKGCVRAVVIEDIPASDWAHARGYGLRQSKAHGMSRLRLGLQGLARHFGLDKVHRT